MFALGWMRFRLGLDIMDLENKEGRIIDKTGGHNDEISKTPKIAFYRRLNNGL